jgi:hypothetical protein
MGWFRKKRASPEEELPSIWKVDFSDCVAADYLPSYSVCLNRNNSSCRYLAYYSGMKLCGHPMHKSFIPDDAEPFNPRQDRFRD